MKFKYIFGLFGLLAVFAFLAVSYGTAQSYSQFFLGDPELGSLAIFGFIGKVVKGAVGIAGKQLGLAGSGKNFEVTTRQDPAIAEAAKRQSATIDKLLSLSVEQAQAKSSGNFLTMKVFGVPLVGVLAVGGLAIGAIFVFRK